MKPSLTKYIIGDIFVLFIAAYAIWSSNSNSGSPLPMPPITGGIPFPSATGSSAAPNGRYKDGTYSGSVADAFYGQLQIVATVSGGRLTNVAFPVYPDTAGHSVSLSEYALPRLAREALVVQSANVQIVSGATQDSTAFQQSLGSALAQAQ
jgi:uncharacterized protein with FMN-binding domain